MSQENVEGLAAAVPPERPPSISTGYYGHFLSPPGDVSLFCPGEHLPDPFVSGLPAPGPLVIAADATPLAASAMHEASGSRTLLEQCLRGM
jgi:hypothetical protein